MTNRNYHHHFYFLTYLSTSILVPNDREKKLFKQGQIGWYQVEGDSLAGWYMRNVIIVTEH